MKENSTADAEPLSSQEMIEMAVALMIAARDGGWHISSQYNGDLSGTDRLELQFLRTRPEESGSIEGVAAQVQRDKSQEEP